MAGHTYDHVSIDAVCQPAPSFLLPDEAITKQVFHSAETGTTAIFQFPALVVTPLMMLSCICQHRISSCADSVIFLYNRNSRVTEVFDGAMRSRFPDVSWMSALLQDIGIHKR